MRLSESLPAAALCAVPGVWIGAACLPGMRACRPGMLLLGSCNRAWVQGWLHPFMSSSACRCAGQHGQTALARAPHGVACSAKRELHCYADTAP